MTKKIIFLILGAGIFSLSVFRQTWWLSFAGLLPLLYVLTVSSLNSKNPVKENMLFGAVYGIVFYGISLSWMKEFGWYAWVGVTVLEGIFTVIFSGLFHFFITKKGNSPRHQICRFFLMTIGISCLWTCLDYVRSLGPLGFSWYGIFHFQAYNRLLIQYISYLGPYFLDFAVVSLNMCVIYSIVQKRNLFKVGIYEEFFAFLGIFLFIVLHIGGLPALRAPIDSGFSASLLQGSCNIWDGDDDRSLKVYSDLLGKVPKNTDIAIFPETAFLDLENNKYISVILKSYAREKNLPLVVGANTGKGPNMYNSAILLDRDGKIKGQQNKIHLVPFGEYVPKFIPIKVEAMRDYDALAGNKIRILNPSNSKIRLACGICYDACFPGFFRESSKYANVFAIISNDIWFGKGYAPRNHYMMNVLRAVENRRFILRCGYNGISGIITPYGESIAETKLDERCVLTRDFGLTDYITPYAKWGKYFPYIGIIFWIFLIPPIIFMQKYR